MSPAETTAVVLSSTAAPAAPQASGEAGEGVVIAATDSAAAACGNDSSGGSIFPAVFSIVSILLAWGQPPHSSGKIGGHVGKVCIPRGGEARFTNTGHTHAALELLHTAARWIRSSTLPTSTTHTCPAERGGGGSKTFVKYVHKTHTHSKGDTQKMMALTGVERSYASAIGQTMQNLTVRAEVGSVMESMLADLEAWEWANKEEVLKNQLDHTRAQVQALKESERELLEVRRAVGMQAYPGRAG